MEDCIDEMRFLDVGLDEFVEGADCTYNGDLTNPKPTSEAVVENWNVDYGTGGGDKLDLDSLSFLLESEDYWS